MKYCPECGYYLDKGTVKFCSECEEKLGQKVVAGTERDDNKISSIGIHDTKGDILGTGFSGSGNIIGKEVTYTIEGNIVNLNVNNLSYDVLEALKSITNNITQTGLTYENDNRSDKAKIQVKQGMVRQMQFSKIFRF